MKSPVLQYLGTLIVSFQYGNFKRIKTFSVHGLLHAYFQQIFNDLHITIGSCIMKQCIVAIVSFVVSWTVVEQIKK